jgi:hypothetical protein
MEGGGFVDAGTAFYEELRVVVGVEEKVLRVPCSMPAGPPSVVPSDAQLRQLQPLLKAHKAALAAQKECLDAAGLLDTFEPLQQLVRELQGICARRVDLTDEVLEPLFPDIYEEGGMQTLPEDLRRLKEQVRELHVQSSQLQELPGWIGEFGRLETLDLRGEEEDDVKENEEMTELPESIGNLACLKSLYLHSFVQLKVLPDSILSEG